MSNDVYYLVECVPVNEKPNKPPYPYRALHWYQKYDKRNMNSFSKP